MSYLVAITGGSGSGKTTFLRRLIEKIGQENVCTISQDNYYKPKELQAIDENGFRNFDLPEAIEYDHFIRDVKKLKGGQTVERMEYTYNNPTLTPKLLVFEPKPIIIVEGLFVLHYPEIVKLVNLKIFVDAKDHIKMKRRILRDEKERGYDLEDVLYRYENHVMPCYDKYIRIHKDDADIVVNNNKNFDIALEVISHFIRSKVT
ncbi:MAG: uridine-cytidine kinase [Cytophagales bacterium]|nr:uridine-cytidine kinase [Cytophagales bacterium]MDW8384213.1 uridine-cytidine kinase [Flammeovirgaceae bacterium]